VHVGEEEEGIEEAAQTAAWGSGMRRSSASAAGRASMCARPEEGEDAVGLLSAAQTWAAPDLARTRRRVAAELALGRGGDGGVVGKEMGRTCT
jgi:hypothetical protein